MPATETQPTLEAVVEDGKPKGPVTAPVTDDVDDQNVLSMAPTVVVADPAVVPVLRYRAARRVEVAEFPTNWKPTKKQPWVLQELLRAMLALVVTPSPNVAVELTALAPPFALSEIDPILVYAGAVDPEATRVGYALAKSVPLAVATNALRVQPAKPAFL